MYLKGSSSQAKMESQNVKNVPAADDKKPPRPQPDLVEKCPRCDSVNTKFCYYNNYSLSQPRYFCKACRRYWTKGGTLRNVPVGGGCRKNRRSAKRAFDNHHHLLVQSHNQMEINNNSNLMLSSSTFDQNITQSSLKLADHSNFSSPLAYEDSGTCDGLSLAFATLHRQSNVEVHHHNLNGFEFEPQNSILVHQPITSSGTNTLGFLSNFLEPQTTSSFKYSQGLYNHGFENGGGDQGHGDHHTQPLHVGNEDLKQKMNENRILLGLPWQVGSSNNNAVGQGSLEDNSSSNVVFGTGTGSGNYNYYNNDGYYAVEGGDGRSERWNRNAGLAGGAGSAWPNLINTTALIM